MGGLSIEELYGVLEGCKVLLDCCRWVAGGVFGVIGFGLGFLELDGVTRVSTLFKEAVFHAFIITAESSWNTW